MTLAEAAVVLGSLVGLAAAGWLFLNHSLYRDHEEKDPVVQVQIVHFSDSSVRAAQQHRTTGRLTAQHVSYHLYIVTQGQRYGGGSILAGELIAKAQDG